MQSASIALSNGITTIEMYATFKVRPIFVFLGQSLFHFIVMLPFALALAALALLSGIAINSPALLGVLILSFLFLSFVSIVVGGIIPNTNMA